MNQLTYKEAETKIFDAYFKDEIKPLDANFCFCGTLSKGGKWKGGDELYLSDEYDRMEMALLNELSWFPTYCTGNFAFAYIPSPEYEEKLFDGMVAALDVLKQIHRERNENVDDEPITFKKRELSMQ